MDKSKIIEAINKAAKKFNVDPALLTRIATAESQLDPFAKNPSSSASGLFQFTRGTWDELANGADISDIEKQAEIAAREVAKGNIFRWYSSAGKWGNADDIARARAYFNKYFPNDTKHLEYLERDWANNPASRAVEPAPVVTPSITPQITPTPMTPGRATPFVSPNVNDIKINRTTKLVSPDPSVKTDNSSFLDKLKTLFSDNGQLPNFSNSATPFVVNGVITKKFGAFNVADIYSKGINNGLDIAAPRGADVVLPNGKWKIVHAFDKATAEGPRNPQRGINQGYGNRVVALNMETGEKLAFSHLSKVNVKVGDLISGGVVGKVGATGNTAGRTGVHLDTEYYDPSGKLKDVTKTAYWNPKAYQEQNPYSLVKPAMAAEKNFSTTIVPTPPARSSVSSSSAPRSSSFSSQPSQPRQVQPIMSSQTGNTRLINPGESLSAIAKSYNTTWQNLAKMNPQIKDPNKIYAGDALYVPAARVVPTPVKKTTPTAKKVYA